MPNKKVMRFIIGLVVFLAVFELVSRVLIVVFIWGRHFFLPNVSDDTASSISTVSLIAAYVIGIWIGIRAWMKIYSSKWHRNTSA